MLLTLTPLRRNWTRDVGQIVLNTDFMNELRVYGTGSRFEYFHFPESRRSGHDTYIVEESNATILAAMDTAFFANAITLNTYDIPNHMRLQDTDKVTTPTVFNVKEIVAAWPYSRKPADMVASWIIINEKGFHPERYLVDSIFTNIPGLAETGTTTTTSTSTTSTSTTSTTSTTTTTTGAYDPEPHTTTSTTTTSSTTTVEGQK